MLDLEKITLECMPAHKWDCRWARCEALRNEDRRERYVCTHPDISDGIHCPECNLDHYNYKNECRVYKVGNGHDSSLDFLRW